MNQEIKINNDEKLEYIVMPRKYGRSIVDWTLANSCYGMQYPTPTAKVIPVEKRIPKVTKVIFCKTKTIVFFDNKTKTIVTRCKGDRNDPEKAVAMAILKQVYGNKGNYYDVIRDALDKSYTKDCKKKEK